MEHLKEIRKNRGLLQKDVASFLGIDRTTYVKYENGDNEPSNDILIKLSTFFGVTTDYLLGVSDVPNTIHSPAFEKSEIETLFNKLNTLGKEKAESYILDLLDNPKYAVDSEINPNIPSLEEAMRLQEGTPSTTLHLGHDNIVHKAAFGGGVWDEKKHK